MLKKYLMILIGAGLIGLAGLLIYSLSGKPGLVPSVAVSDQSIQNGQIIVSQANAPARSWLVVQTETNGVPGPVIGYARIEAGQSKDIAVGVEGQSAGRKLFAMIHEDAGEKGRFDFPDNDMPLLYQGEMISQMFTVR